MNSHGTKQSYDYQKCRCVACRKANAEYHRGLREELTSRPKDPLDPRHGTGAFYKNHGCRCIPCKAAHGEDVRAGYQQRLSSGARDNPDDRRHGTNSFYVGWGCRCEPCKEASRQYKTANRKTSVASLAP